MKFASWSSPSASSLLSPLFLLIDSHTKSMTTFNSSLAHCDSLAPPLTTSVSFPTFRKLPPLLATSNQHPVQRRSLDLQAHSSSLIKTSIPIQTRSRLLTGSDPHDDSFHLDWLPPPSSDDGEPRAVLLQEGSLRPTKTSHLSRTTALRSSTYIGFPQPGSRTTIDSIAPTPRQTITRYPGEIETDWRMLYRRWEGWQTATYTSFVTDTQDIPTAVTVYETYGESPGVDGGTTTITKYQGASTLTVQGPSYLTITIFPTSTTYHTVLVTTPTTTKTKTKTPTAISTATMCAPGDASVKQTRGLTPTHDQSITLYVIAIYIVGIGIAWNLIFIRDAIYPFKMLVCAIHETGHLLVCICFGAQVKTFCIDPVLGGLIELKSELPLPVPALPMGYLFNIIIGGLLTYCGFNTLASKIASFIVGLAWLGLFMAASGITKGLTLAAAGLMVGLWWADHAWGLRFYILFIGVMSSFYVLWDVMDELLFTKQNPSCPSQHAVGFAMEGSEFIFTLAYFGVSFIFFVLFVLAALATWKETHHAMYCQALTFLPT
ncbi:hypothetical protein T439DRAFT_160328 [Meredithblackwellia eburnea MCA 4105]